MSEAARSHTFMGADAQVGAKAMAALQMGDCYKQARGIKEVQRLIENS